MTPSRLAMASRTLEAMARSGMYDQLAGGFARYAVDAGWVVPHFEKMLYDNALLLRAYTTWWKVTRDPLAERIVRETADFVVRDLGTETRRFRVVARRRRRRRRGADVRVDTASSCARSSATTTAPSRPSCSASRRTGPSSTAPRRCSCRSSPADRAWFDDVRRTAARRPRRSDRSPAATTRSSRRGTVSRSPRWPAPAPRSTGRTGSRRPTGAPATSSTSTSSTASCGARHASASVGTARAVADDHGNLAEGLLVLHQATGELRWLDAAREVLDAARDFAADDGGFHDTAEDAEPLYLRPRSAADNAEPAGQSALAAALVTLGAVTGDAGSPRRRAPAPPPRAWGWPSASRASAVGRSRSPRRSSPDRSRSPSSGRVRDADALEAAARRSPSPGLVVVRGEPDAPGRPAARRPPARRTARAAAYVCRGMVCELPTTDPEQLAEQLGAWLARGVGGPAR